MDEGHIPVRLLARYGVAIAAVAFAVLLRLLFAPVIGDRIPFVTLFAAVAASAWFGGVGPALFATVAGYVVTYFLFIAGSSSTLQLTAVAGLGALAAYLLSCALIIALGSYARANQRRADEAARQSRANQAALEEATRKLEETGRHKDEFLATLGHELRNPLSAIGNAQEILRLNVPMKPEVRWAREMIAGQVQILTRLVDDLLDVTRISRGTLDLRVERVELAAIVQRAIDTSRPLIDGAGHELSVALPDDPIYVHGDEVRLCQVIANILNNAAKFTPRGGRISLSGQLDGDQVMVSIRDNGAGISADMLEAIFEMYSQAPASSGRTPAGLGIGLSLARKLVAAHGGRIEARSEGPGTGSEFIVWLPVARGDSAVASGRPPPVQFCL